MNLVNGYSVQAPICELLLSKYGFGPRVFHVGCVMDIMAEGTRFSLITSNFSC